MLLKVGTTGTIIATVEPIKATNKNVNWSSSDPNVATVDNNGVVTAVAAGEATITATSAADSSKKASCVVTVPLTISKIDVVDGADGVTSIVIPQAGQMIRANIILSDGTPIHTYPVDKRVTYEWYYGESTDTILGTEGSYTVTADNVGKTICVRVGVDGIGEANWEAARKIVIIDRIDVVEGADGVASIVTPQTGQVIRANIILSDGTPIYTYPEDTRVTYEWYYGESTDTILGREGSYTVTIDNVGKTICLRVSVKGIGEANWEAAEEVAVSTDAYVAIVASLPKNNDGKYTAASWAYFKAAIDNCDLTLTVVDGQAALDAEVEKIQAALDLLVEVEGITAASVVVTAPVLGEKPNGAADVEKATNDPNFSVTNVSWIGDFTPEGNFRAEHAYSATMELTATVGKTFAAESFEVTVGDVSISDVEISSTSEGNTATFTVTFAETGDLKVIKIAVKTPPCLGTYFENITGDLLFQNRLNLQALVVTLNYNDGTSENVSYSKSNFSNNGITVSPSHDTELTRNQHNGMSVILSHIDDCPDVIIGQLSVAIGVSKIDVVVDGTVVTGTTIEIKKGTSLVLEAVISPENATNKSMKWSDSNTTLTIAKINDYCARVTAQNTGGPFTIKATAQDGTVTSGQVRIKAVQ